MMGTPGPLLDKVFVDYRGVSHLGKIR